MTGENIKYPGIIVGFAGNMGSGKSHELMKEVHRPNRQKAGVLFLQPREANRSSPDEARSRTGANYKGAVGIDYPKEIMPLVVERDPKFIFIDEIQFFGKTPEMTQEFLKVIGALMADGRHIFWCGLPLDFTGRPFEIVAQMMAWSDRLRLFEVECEVCGQAPATMPQRMRNGQPVPRSDPRFISDTDENKSRGVTYEARCRRCHQIAPEPDPSAPAN